VKALQKIFSLSLLSIYSLIIVHNVVPHSHDFSELNDETNELVHHDHDHHHHGHDGAHSHHDDHGEDWLSFLIDLFEGLEHSNLEDGQFEDYVITKVRFKDDLPASISPDTDGVIEFNVENTVIAVEGAVASIDPPPLLLEHLQICSDPLRGPPSLS
jgi:hypothetical protein